MPPVKRGKRQVSSKDRRTSSMSILSNRCPEGNGALLLAPSLQWSGTSGAPCRCAQVLLAVLCLALLAGLIALGVLYIQKSNRSDSLEEENSNLSISLSSVEQRLAGAEWELKEL
ncbi:hypothetical protein SKAU_G00405460 [Synaphobranchus kaupii]|uniref:Uncharacterized protein n=1 Tax=Synaphobranchus kaupii TaxID=118154 RepID=A0A9Q1ICT8_SYNKA|nr:hypothetical protein SKAU_G00405460 [Synaphobranchus kaupii]